MKTWKMLLAVPLALIGSQAIAENWVAVGTDSSGGSVFVDKDSIRQGSDHLTYFTDKSFDIKSQNAADCQKHIYYPVSLGGADITDWRHHGQANPSSAAKAEVRYVCANGG